MEYADYCPESLMTLERLEFYELIRSNIINSIEQTRKEIPEFDIYTVAAGATGGRVADILLTVPVADNGVIYMIDNGKFFDRGNVPDTDKDVYFNMYKRQDELGKISHGLTLILDSMNAGRQTMINWELESLGITEVNWHQWVPEGTMQGGVRPAWECEFKYAHPGESSKTLRLRFIQGLTTDIYHSDIRADYYFEGRGIDLQVIKGAQQAFEESFVLRTMFKQVNLGGLILTDQAGIFDLNRRIGSESDRMQTLLRHMQEHNYQLFGEELDSRIVAMLEEGFHFGYEREDDNELTQLAIVSKKARI